MQNTTPYYVNGELVYIPDDELDEFMAESIDTGVNVEQADSFWMEDGGGTAEYHVPQSKSADFLAEAERRGVRTEPMKVVQMDDGAKLTLGMEDLRQLVQAQRQGLDISRGMLRNTDIPEQYGRSKEERAAIARRLGDLYSTDFPESDEERSARELREAGVDEGDIVIPEGQYGLRNDGKTYKGTGWLGELRTADGGVATEYTSQSNAVTDENGNRIDFPTLVPTLTKDEVDLMVNDIIPNQKPVPDDIMQKAVDHAKKMIGEGKSVFANDGMPTQELPPEPTEDAPGGFLDYMKTTKEAEYGRNLNGLEATAANLPFAGSVMDSNEKRKESVEKRLYSGDFRDSLEASKLALSIGIPQEEVKRVNSEAGGDDEAMRKGFASLVRDQLANRIETRQSKGEKLDKFDLNLLQEAGAGAAGLVKTVTEMASPAVASATIGPSMMNRAAGLNSGEWKVDENGNPIQTMTGDGGDLSMMKGLGGALAERAIWMNPWMGKWAGAVAKKAGGSMVANNTAQIVDMTLKNDLSDLVDNVVGLNKSEAETNKTISDWAEEHFMPQNLLKDIVHSAVAHVGMKGMRLVTKGGRESLSNEIKAEIVRRGEIEAQKQEKAAVEEEKRQARREVARETYDATMSDEAAFEIDAAIDAQIKAGTVSEAMRDKVKERVLNTFENRRSLDDADLREGAVINAVNAVNAELATPERVTSPALERRQTEAKMKANEAKSARRDKELADYEAEESAARENELNRQGAEINADIDAQNAAHDKRKADIKHAFNKADDEAMKQAYAERKAAAEEYERTEAERKAREEAEQNAPETVEAKPAPVEGEATDLRDSPEYKEWLRKSGRNDTDKNWNRYVGEMELDPALRVDRNHNGPNAETVAERQARADEESAGRRIEASAEEQRRNDEEAAQGRRIEDQAKSMRAAREAAMRREEREQREGWKEAERNEAETPEERDYNERMAAREEARAKRGDTVAEEANSAYEAEQQRLADEKELADFAKGEGDEVAAKRARQADLEAAFADWKDTTMKKTSAQKKGSPVKDETPTENPTDFADFCKGDKILQALDKEYRAATKAIDKGDVEYRVRERITELRDEWAKRNAKPTEPPRTGELARPQSPEPIATDSAKASQTEPAAPVAEPTHEPVAAKPTKATNPKAGGRAPKATDAAFRAWAVDRDGKPIEFATKADEKASRDLFDSLVKQGKLDPKTGKPLAAAPTAGADELARKNPLPKSADPKAGGRSAKEEMATETQYDRAVKAVEIAERESANARSFDELADINSRARSALGKITSEQENELMARLDKAWKDNKGRVENVRSQGGYTPSKEILEAKSRIEAMPTFTSREKAAKKKAQKDWLLSSVDDAIKSHGDTRTINKKPFSESFADEFESLLRRNEATYDAKKLGKIQEQIAAAKRTMAKGEMITFDVPDDGTFKIRNNPEALAVFKRMVQKRLSPTNLKEGTISKAEKPLAEDVKEANIGEKVTSPASINQTSAKAPTNQTTNPDAVVTSAQKLLKEKFYQSAADLTRQLKALPAQAPADLRAAYETALAAAKRRNEARQQLAQRTMAQKLADPDFQHWAQKNGRTATDQARRDYDAQQVDALGKHITKNWIKGVTFRRSENAAEVPTNARQLYSRDGEVIGWYDSAKKEVVTLPGADAGTVAHELGWHATYDHAKTLAAAGDRTLLDKLDKYADNAKRIIVDPATGRTLEQEITTRYQRNGITDPAVLLDEIGAARYTMEQITKIKDAAARRQAAKWYGRAWDAVTDTYKSMLTKLGWNKARLDNLAALTPNETVNLLADEMLRGRNLGKATPATQIDMNKGESLVQLHDRKLKDYLRPLEELEKEAGKTVSASAHSKMRVLPGKVQKSINEAEAFSNDIKDACKKAGIKIAELNEFMYARGAGERNAKVLARNGRLKGSAMSHADIQRVLNAYQASPKYAELVRIADEVLAFQKRGFIERIRNGLIDRQTALDLMAEEPHHVPMKSRFDADGNHLGFDSNATFGRPEFREAKGRTNIGDGPLEWILQEYVDAKSRSALNNARQSLLATVLTHPEVGTVRRLRDGERSSEIRRKGMVGNPNVISVKSNGATYEITLNGKRGELIAAAMTGRNIARPPEAIQKAMRWWSSTATEWSPTFSGRNFIADTIDVVAVNLGEHGLIKGMSKNAQHVFNAFALVPAIREYVNTGKTNNAVLREAIDAGVLMGGGVRSQAFDMNENALQTLKNDFTKGKSRVRAVGKALFGWVNTLNQTAELMNRMADYKMQRKNGKSKTEAALHAREITVDFNEKGELTPNLNLAYMFSNSTLGATMRLNKAIFINPNTGKVNWKNGSQLVGSVFALGLIEGAAEAYANGDDEEGKNTNEFTRANSLYFRKGKDIYRIPIHPSPISVIKYAGNCAARKMLGTLGKDKAANQIADDMIGIVTQFAGIGDIGDNKLSGAFPSIIQPVIQAAMNRDFADRPIEKPAFNESKPKSHNGRTHTADEYKWGVQELNALGGGNEARKGKILGVSTDVSPEMLKHFTEAVGKNALRDIANAAEVGRLAVSWLSGEKTLKDIYKESDRRNIPVVRDYYRTTGGNDNRYFESSRSVKDDMTEWNGRKSKMTRDERRAYLDDHPWCREGVQERLRLLENGSRKSGILGINSLRHLVDGKTYDGKERKMPATDEQIESWREQLRRKQAKYIELTTKR